MKPPRPFRITVLAGLALSMLSACAQTAKPPESQRLAQELRTAIGEPGCALDGDCASLPVGAKACGGPAGYLAWAPSRADAKRVQALAAAQAAAQRREHEASGMRSNCAMEQDPGAACVAARCQLRNSPSAAAQ